MRRSPGRCWARWRMPPSGIGLMTAVTCPIMRYHPAIIAQAAATVALLSDDRFTLGLGAGERLNEHVMGVGWPGMGERHERLVGSDRYHPGAAVGQAHRLPRPLFPARPCQAVRPAQPQAAGHRGGRWSGSRASRRREGDGLIATEAASRSDQGFTAAGGRARAMPRSPVLRRRRGRGAQDGASLLPLVGHRAGRCWPSCRTRGFAAASEQCRRDARRADQLRPVARTSSRGDRRCSRVGHDHIIRAQSGRIRMPSSSSSNASWRPLCARARRLRFTPRPAAARAACRA